MEIEIDRYECMENSILKNLQELSELCVDNDITNAYDLMDLVVNYKTLISYVLNQNSRGGTRGIHDRILKQLNYEIESGGEK